MSTQRTFKRTGWTTEEVMLILKDCMITPRKRSDPDYVDEYAEAYNDGVQAAVEHFFDYTRPQEEFGAMAYCVEENMTWHIGTIPEEDRGPPRKHGCRVRPRPVAQPSPDGTESAADDDPKLSQ